MEWAWMFDPTVQLGFITLVLLEIILGIDNLVFVAVLADKLPPIERDRACRIGLILFCGGFFYYLKAR